jgi:UDP-N-acetylmuramate dehydrogenase
MESREISIQSNVSLKEYTTFHIGGAAKYFIAVTSVSELRNAVAWAKEKKVPTTILGGGSNVFVSDKGVRGLVVHNTIKGRSVAEDGDDVLLTVGAGEVFDEIVSFAIENGWWGIENLSCIPGSVGATPIQNIGAYGVEIQDRIVLVQAYDAETDVSVELAKEVCAFEYRDSIFKHEEGKRYIVTGVTYRLTKKPSPVLHYHDLVRWNEARVTAKKGDEMPTLGDIRAAICAIRSEKFPDWNVIGTAGSFFKNPIILEAHFKKLLEKYPLLPGHATGDGLIKVPLGWILDHVLHVRGYRQGNVGTYEGQALVLVNHGDATAAELERFVENISEKIFNATKIVVEWEVTKLS